MRLSARFGASYLSRSDRAHGQVDKPSDSGQTRPGCGPSLGSVHPLPSYLPYAPIRALLYWLGWLDSNQRMRESKSRALPLGYTPTWGIKENMGLGFSPNPMFSMGWVMGLEPTTLGTTIRCSNQLSYTHHIDNASGTVSHERNWHA